MRDGRRGHGSLGSAKQGSPLAATVGESMSEVKSKEASSSNRGSGSYGQSLCWPLTLLYGMSHVGTKAPVQWVQGHAPPPRALTIFPLFLHWYLSAGWLACNVRVLSNDPHSADSSSLHCGHLWPFVFIVLCCMRALHCWELRDALVFSPYLVPCVLLSWERISAYKVQDEK